MIVGLLLDCGSLSVSKRIMVIAIVFEGKPYCVLVVIFYEVNDLPTIILPYLKHKQPIRENYILGSTTLK